MRIGLFILTFFASVSLWAQQNEVDFDAVDSLYREDQFYISFTYNSLQNRPEGISQQRLSPGISLGFLRDIPINKRRTVAVAPGFGFSYTLYNSNLGISNASGTYSYSVLDSNEFSTDKLSLYNFDLPIEFRWRTSTPESHKFWRIYSGFKMSYLFYDHYKLVATNGITKIDNNKDLNPWQYGLYCNFGWNTWNFYAYYGLNSLFKSKAKIDNQPMDMHAINFGLIFYIL